MLSARWEIKELIELVAEKDFTEFELVRGRFKLRLGVEAPDPKPVLVVSQDTTGASPVSEVRTAETAQPEEASTVLRLNQRRRRDAPPAPSAEESRSHLSPRRSSAHSTTQPRLRSEPFVNVGDSDRGGQDTLHHRGHEAHE